jgi:hypothetical protein
MADASRFPFDTLFRLVNSTTVFGNVIERRLFRLMRDISGMSFLATADGKYVNLYRFILWVLAEVARGRNLSAIDAEIQAKRYERHRDNMALRIKSMSQISRDIAPTMPERTDVEGYVRARQDFRFFCEHFLSSVFYLRWSRDHLRAIEKIERAVLSGGQFAFAMPRGSGKTVLSIAACLWAILYGHHEFVVLIGSDEEHAISMLDTIKTELETNDKLHAAFPEATHPIRCLSGITKRSHGQLFRGERTHIECTANSLTLATIPGAACSGAAIRVSGITGRIRGMTFHRPDGRTVRPSLVVIDDPQTDESARSPTQCAMRENILNGAILGLAGPGKKISAIMPCTVIYPNDLADRILNRDLHPEWSGERMKMLYAMPENLNLWYEYKRILDECLASGSSIEKATEFYQAHREEMDRGAVVAWPERFNHDELSAIQHAMNLWLRDDRSFQAEYQNTPVLDNAGVEEYHLNVSLLSKRLSMQPRAVVPAGCTTLTAFIDSHQNAIYYLVCAWTETFDGYVIDYGTTPEQSVSYFSLREIPVTLQSYYNTNSVETMVSRGIAETIEKLMSRSYPVADSNATLKIDRCLVDASWGAMTDVVYKTCKDSVYAASVFPSHGKYVGASSRPMNEWSKGGAVRVGLHWRIHLRERGIRHVVFDTNFWKSFVYSRLVTERGQSGTLFVFGTNAAAHRLFFDHLLAEYFVPVESRGRIVNEWKLRASNDDNHWWDCLVGAAVAASIQGVSLPEYAEKRKREKVNFAQWQREARAKYLRAYAQ